MTTVKAQSFWMGTGIFVGLSLILAIFLYVYVGFNTIDKTQEAQ